MPKTYYITTPIYYVNDSPHIGHAYTSLACDVLARFKRLNGFEVKFLTGTDEHGQKVETSAKVKNLLPKDFTDQVSERFRELAKIMNFSNDDFIRTTEERHIKAAQAIWNTLIEKGEIYLGKYEGWYAVRDEAFYAEGELINGKAPTGADVEWIVEPSYFFRLSKWQDRLLKFYQENPDFIAPVGRHNEVVSFVKGGLHDLSVSRTTFTWGVPIPRDEQHIMYVWLDALVNYMSAVDYPNVNSENYKKFWPADIHVVGKDILRFHTVYWPAFLMAADLPVPKKVFAHGWWTNEGQKISKSLGNVIDPLKLVEEFGLDKTRYFLLREVPFGNDGNFSKEAMVTRTNADLANNIGNLMQRTLSFINKNCAAKTPAYSLNAEDQELIEYVYSSLEQFNHEMESLAFHNALSLIAEIASKSNEYIDLKAPWQLKKVDAQRMNSVLFVLAEVLKCVGLLLLPFMPDSANQMLDQLGVSASDRNYECFGKTLTSGTTLPTPKAIFPRIET